MKNKVLQILEEKRGKVISGSEIAQRLNITRSAVWKMVQTLKQQGYLIDGVTNRGYCFAEENDVLSKLGIQNALNTNVMGKEILLFESLESTNTLAKEYAAKGEPEGTLILARGQTKGKGRMGKSFHSPSGTGLYMSLILRPKLLAEESVLITVCAAVAVCRAIEKIVGLKAQIKWVNDIYYKGKKLCGILTEASLELESGGLSFVVMGIGINLAPPDAGYPHDIETIATSLAESAPHRKFFKNQLAAEILNQFEEMYVHLEDKEFMEEYIQRSCLIGKDIEIIQNNKITYAKAIGITENAMLIAEGKDGNSFTLNSGEVKIRIPNK